jgi:MFS family permease
LITYQAYFLLEEVGSAEDDVPRQIFLGTLVQSALVISASLVSGRMSDRTGRRKVFVLLAAVVYGLALLVVASANSLETFLMGMALSGVGFGMYVAVDLALVIDVLSDQRSTAKDLGVFNIAGALPFAIGPALAPAILAAASNSYAVLYGVAGLCALLSAAAILPVKRVR